MRLRCLLILFAALLQTQAFGIYLGGGGDGAAHRLQSSTYLNGAPAGLTPLYLGGSGDGSSSLAAATLSLDGAQISALYQGGNGDGFAALTLSQETLDGFNLQLLYGGGDGDGHNSQTYLGLFLNGGNVTVLYQGGSGDGSATLTEIGGLTFDGSNLTELFTGGNGDGSSQLQANEVLLAGGSLAAIYSGGEGDGHSLYSAVGQLLNGQSLQMLYSGGDGDGHDLHTAIGLLMQDALDSDGDILADIVDPDDDNDLMPDIWEELFGFNPLDAVDAGQDLDMDGMTNLDEYIADTLPDDDSSFFHIWMIKTLTGVDLGFDSSTQRLYQMEQNTNLPSNVWTPIGPEQMGTGFNDGRSVSPGIDPSSLRMKVRVP